MICQCASRPTFCPVPFLATVNAASLRPLLPGLPRSSRLVHNPTIAQDVGIRWSGTNGRCNDDWGYRRTYVSVYFHSSGFARLMLCGMEKAVRPYLLPGLHVLWSQLKRLPPHAPLRKSCTHSRLDLLQPICVHTQVLAIWLVPQPLYAMRS